MYLRRTLGLGLAVVTAATIMITAAGAGTGHVAIAKIDLSTNAGVAKYLRSIHVNPKGVVIQRGARNYAGPNCPGKGWNCTRSQKVVQIATPGRARPSSGTRSFLAKPPPPPPPPTNVAKCSRTTLSSQSCSVVQDAPAGTSNSAQVDETITQSGQTLNGSQDAQITQTSVNGSNKVQLNLKITQSASTGGASVSQSLTSSQNFSISQTSTMGGAQSIQVEESSTQTEAATNPTASGSQYASGDLFGDISQSSSGVSTAKIRQIHNVDQSADAGANVDQTVVDPFKCCATQGTNPNNTFGLIQSGFVKTMGDATPNITAVYEADCQSSGNCTVTETQNTNGTTSTNTSSGSTVNTGFNCTGTTCTEEPITFDGSPGTGPPPATLGPYTMTPFGSDGRPLGEQVSGVSDDAAGTIGFDPSLTHTRVGVGWSTWSHGYTGDVYYISPGSQITIMLPAGTKAFYFYAEPNVRSVFSVEATAQDGTTSGPVSVNGNAGAKYFGFYGTGAATLESITVTTSADADGLAVGEFGINPSAAPPIT
jgi:hypothetical protein